MIARVSHGGNAVWTRNWVVFLIACEKGQSLGRRCDMNLNPQTLQCV